MTQKTLQLRSHEEGLSERVRGSTAVAHFGLTSNPGDYSPCQIQWKPVPLHLTFNEDSPIDTEWEANLKSDSEVPYNNTMYNIWF